jgi:Mlc titration factor MtfA (ptsG expression regulator)
MRFETPWRRRRRALDAPFSEAWRRVLERRWGLWPTFDELERSRLERLTTAFLLDRRFEAAKGFAVTDEVRVLVAAQASLLLLGFDEAPDVDLYANVQSIIVHRGTVMLHGSRTVGATGSGLVSDERMAVSGQAHHRGPVLLAWSTVAYEARHPARGQNVVLHEFAHQLDMLDGIVDGTPPIPEPARRDRFVEICDSVYQQVRRHDDAVLRDYAGTDPGEFFAVATETFFSVPLDLRREHPELYLVLADFYGQDPAARHERHA